MVKPTMVSATLLVVVAVLAMAEASSAFRTIHIEVEGGRNPGEKEGMCVEQMMKQQMMSHCQMYLREAMRASLMNPGRGKEESVDMCCGQLERMDEECRCDALKTAAVMQIPNEHTERTEMMEKMMDEAEKMYSQCNLSPRTCYKRRGE